MATMNLVIQAHKPYCFLCGGPAMDVIHAKDNDTADPESFLSSLLDNHNPTATPGTSPLHTIEGVTPSDTDWLTRTVVVYADCITPAGQYIRDQFCVRPFSSQELDERQSQLGCEDPIAIPEWANENRPGFAEYHVVGQEGDCYLAHETCIFFAAAYSKVCNPARFLPPSPPPSTSSSSSSTSTPKQRGLPDPIQPLDPSKFLWDKIGPVPLPISQTWHRNESPSTFEYILRSAVLAQDLPPPLDLSEFWKEFGYGYGYDDGEAEKKRWMRGRKGRWYIHEPSFGTTHLKRPDSFPAVHRMEPDSLPPPETEFNLFPRANAVGGVPIEIVLMILNTGILEGPDIRALECVSRSWRDLFRTPLLQTSWWRASLETFSFVPLESDWTASARRVREAFCGTGKEGECDEDDNRMGWDWRRYYNDCRKSGNMSNRRRIAFAVTEINHALRNCACPIEGEDGESGENAGEGAGAGQVGNEGSGTGNENGGGTVQGAGNGQASGDGMVYQLVQAVTTLDLAGGVAGVGSSSSSPS